MQNNKTREALASTSIFEGLSIEDLNLFIKHGHNVSIKQSEYLLRKAEEVYALYVVVSGKLRVYLPADDGGDATRRPFEVELNVLEPNDYFGEYSIVSKAKASASVIAVEDAVVAVILRNVFDDIVAENERIAKIVYRNMLLNTIHRLREREKEYGIEIIED